MKFNSPQLVSIDKNMYFLILAYGKIRMINQIILYNLETRNFTAYPITRKYTVYMKTQSQE